MSTISSVVISCLKQFKTIISSDNLKVYRPEVPQSLWQDELGRLRVWAANIGAHQTGQSSLDHRLRDASHIKDQTLRVLRRLHRLIQDLHDALHSESVSEDLSDSDDEEGGKSEMQIIYQDLHDTIGHLFQLSMIIRKPAQHDRFWGTKRSDAAGFEPFDRQHVINKYPRAEASVLERLGLAISQRRAILRYRERHHIKLGKGLSQAIEDQSDAISTNISETVATHFVEQSTSHSDFDSQSLVSQTSYAQTLLNGDEGMVLPPPPPESEDEAPFECPYCFLIITVSGDNAWARHVFNDLMPYICVFSDCPTPHRLYESRREWYFHLQSQHSVPDESGGYSDCPLCTSSVATGKPFQRHVARHLEELALFALPRIQLEAKYSQTDPDEGSTGGKNLSEGLDSREGSPSRKHEFLHEQPDWMAAELARDRDSVLERIGVGSFNTPNGTTDHAYPPVLPEDLRIRPKDDVEYSTLVVESQRHIILTDPTGIQIHFPLEDCEGWMGLENAILKEFRFVHWNAPQMVRQIEAGQYDILDQTGSVILPDEWHTVAKPGVRITMKMRSSDEQ